jgi:hypothetical protein
MKVRWLLACLLLMVTAVCWGQKAKKEAGKAGKEAEKAAAEAPVAPKVITGYRAGQWGQSQDKVMSQEARHQDIQQEPDYLLQLGVPDDVKSLVPADGKLPRRAPFRNFESMLDLDAAECKAVYYFFDDKLYMIACHEPILREVLKFSGWRERMLERLGKPTGENPDGSMVWDQELTYCKATPNFASSGPHNDDSILGTYTVFLYSKKLKKDVIAWVKENLKAGE